MLAVAAAGVVRLIANGGKMRLLCGADLSADDVEAVKKGHEDLADVVARRMKIRLALPEDDYVKNRLAGAGLASRHRAAGNPGGPAQGAGRPTAAGIGLPRRITTRRRASSPTPSGNKVAFSGSVNESATALVENYESFLVVTSWQTSAYVAAIQTRFNKLWSRQRPGLDRAAHPRGRPAGAAKTPVQRPAHAGPSGTRPTDPAEAA